MSPDLIAEFEHLDSRLGEMIERVRGYAPEIQSAPVGKSYSPIQALDHMAVLEQKYAEMAAKTDRAKLNGRKGKPYFFFPRVIQQMQKPAEKVTPAAPMFNPKGGRSIDEMGKSWRESRAKVVEHLKHFADDEGAIKNPLLGLLSPRDLFILLEKHQDYHDARLPA